MSILAHRRERSVALLEEFLTNRYSAGRLSNDDLVEADLFGVVGDAWFIHPDAGTSLPQLYVGVDERYPATLPRVLLPDAELWHLHIPHVSKDGGLCVLPERATGDSRRVGDVAEEVIRRAVSTITDGVSGENRQDFVAEIESYWAGAASPGAAPVWSLLKPEPPSREIACISCKGFLLVGRTPEECQRWMRNFTKRDAAPVIPGLFVWTERGLYPDEYFESNGELLAFLAGEDPGLAEKLAKLADGQRRSIPVVIAMQTSNGPALLGISLNDFARKPGEKLRGFRAGRLPANLFTRRFEHDPSTRHIVRRVYPEWIHSRGGAKGMTALAEKRFTLIGCGRSAAKSRTCSPKQVCNGLLLSMAKFWIGTISADICSARATSANTSPLRSATICSGNSPIWKSSPKGAHGSHSQTKRRISSRTQTSSFRSLASGPAIPRST